MPFADTQAFVPYFQGTGAFLDELRAIPVDQVPRAQRHRRLRASIPDVTPRLQAYQPVRVVGIRRSIAPYVQQAVHNAGRAVPVDLVPLPGCGWQRADMDGLTRIVQDPTRQGSR